MPDTADRAYGAEASLRLIQAVANWGRVHLPRTTLSGRGPVAMKPDLARHAAKQLETALLHHGWSLIPPRDGVMTVGKEG